MLNRSVEQVGGGCRRGSLSGRRGSIRFDTTTLAITPNNGTVIEPSPFTSTARRGSIALTPLVVSGSSGSTVAAPLVAGTKPSQALIGSISAPTAIEGCTNGGTGSRRGSLLALPLRRGSTSSQKGGLESDFQGQRRGSRRGSIGIGNLSRRGSLGRRPSNVSADAWLKSIEASEHVSMLRKSENNPLYVTRTLYKLADLTSGDANSPMDNCCRNVIDLSGGCEALLEILDAFKKHEVILAIALEVLKNMTRSKEVNKKLGALGIISRVTTIFGDFMNNVAICEACCSVIRNLCQDADNKDNLNEHNVISKVIEALKTHSDHPGISENGCICVFTLCGYSTSLSADNSACRSLLTKFDAITTLRSTVRQHQTCKKVAYYGGTILRDWHEYKMKKDVASYKEKKRLEEPSLPVSSRRSTAGVATASTTTASSMVKKRRASNLYMGTAASDSKQISSSGLSSSTSAQLKRTTSSTVTSKDSPQKGRKSYISPVKMAPSVNKVSQEAVSTVLSPSEMLKQPTIEYEDDDEDDGEDECSNTLTDGVHQHMLLKQQESGRSVGLSSRKEVSKERADFDKARRISYYNKLSEKVEATKLKRSASIGDRASGLSKTKLHGVTHNQHRHVRSLTNLTSRH